MSIEDEKPCVEAVCRSDVFSRFQGQRGCRPKETFECPRVCGEAPERGKGEPTLFGLRNAGGEFPCECSVTALHNGAKGGLARVVREVGKRERLEEKIAQLEARLLQVQKVEAIGTLAGGIAHDFNNILTPIVAHGELALMRLSEGDPVREDVFQICTAARRAATLVNQIQRISRKPGGGTPAPVNLGNLVKDTAKFLRASVPKTIELLVEVDPECGRVLAEPIHLQQVILNLCTNASYAMQDRGGVLAVSVGRVAPGNREGELKARGRLRLTVSDTGPGIPMELQGRIFEPYFTTKPEGQGTGLGLAVTRGIVTCLGGEIRVRSEPGKGATFEVVLPETELEEVPRRVPARELPRGSGHRVLVVDDEQLIRTAVERLLRSLGYRVRVCASGADALEAFRASPDAFDAVFTDQTMPGGMTGLDLAAQLLQIRPDLPVVLGTGNVWGVSERELKGLGLRGAVMKPYAISELAQILHACQLD